MTAVSLLLTSDIGGTKTNLALFLLEKGRLSVADNPVPIIFEKALAGSAHVARRRRRLIRFHLGTEVVGELER